MKHTVELTIAKSRGLVPHFMCVITIHGLDTSIGILNKCQISSIVNADSKIYYSCESIYMLKDKMHSIDQNRTVEYIIKDLLKPHTSDRLWVNFDELEQVYKIHSSSKYPFA